MLIKCAHTDLVNVGDLIPHPRNPNKHPQKQIELLAKIIKETGQRAPIVVSKFSGNIVKGHARYQAILHLGWPKAAVDFQEYSDAKEEYADMVADNKISELAEHNDNQMIRDFEAIGIGPDFDYDMLGIPDFDLDSLTNELYDEYIDKDRGDDIGGVERVKSSENYQDDNRENQSVPGQPGGEAGQEQGGDEEDRPTNAEVLAEVPFAKEINEKNNYIVLHFNDKEDYKEACEKLSIGRVKYQLSTSDNDNFLCAGIGRVIDGKKVIQSL